jgi:hypothetical protein
LLTKSGRSFLVHRLNDLAPAEFAAEGLIDAVDRVAWSRDGSTAILYSHSGNQLQRIRVTASEALVDAAAGFSPSGRLTTLALDPAGRQVALGVEGTGLYLFEAGQSPALLSAMARPAAATFDDTGRRLYAVDLDSQQIVEFDSGSGPLEFAALAQTAAPVPAPAGMAVSANGRYLMVADSSSRAIRVYETASRSLVTTIALDFAPTRLERLASDPLFLLNGDAGNEWLLILDARQTPAIYFVPAGQEELP